MKDGDGSECTAVITSRLGKTWEVKTAGEKKSIRHTDRLYQNLFLIGLNETFRRYHTLLGKRKTLQPTKNTVKGSGNSMISLF